MIYSFWNLPAQSWKNADFAKIWSLTPQNRVKFWPRIKTCTTNRKYSSRAIRCFFLLSSTTLSFQTCRGVHHPPPPVHPWYEKAVCGWGLTIHFVKILNVLSLATKNAEYSLKKPYFSSPIMLHIIYFSTLTSVVFSYRPKCMLIWKRHASLYVSLQHNAEYEFWQN